MTPAEHDTLRESTGLYVLGALSGEEQRRLEEHMETCQECAAEVRSLRAVADTLASGTVMIDPPAALREKVLARVRPDGSRAAVQDQARPDSTLRARSASWWPRLAAAAVLLSVGLGGYALSARRQLRDTEQRLASAQAALQGLQARLDSATRETAGVRASLALLTAPDVRELQLAGQASAPRASARAFVSRSRGVLFAATNLPPLPSGRTYQLWFLTSSTPVSVGLLRPDADGNVSAAFGMDTSSPDPSGLALSLEPEGGVPAPTGPIVLATR